MSKRVSNKRGRGGERSKPKQSKHTPKYKAERAYKRLFR